MSVPDDGRRRLEPPITLIVFLVGMSILGAEIAAARLMAPFFGASTVVWANTIGVVLVSLSVGYWLGGRLADRHPTRDGLYRIILLAGVLLALVPFAADPFLERAVDALDSISAGAFAGSLLGVTVLMGLPILLSGAVAPYALRLAVVDVENAGTVSGRLYAISTVGSLVGTFSSALLLIPLVGTRRTFIVFGLVMVVPAVLGLARRRLLAIVAVPLALLLLPLDTIKGQTDADARVIYETETEYQYARVVEDDAGTRTLELNEGQAVHSVRRADSALTGGIWDEYLVAPLAALSRPPRDLAVLGNGAGTVARAYGRYFPGTRIDGVELDGELTKIGRRFFDLRNPLLTTHTADARPFLRRSSRRYDAIFVDAYRQPYIPFYLATREFFELTRARLRRGGTVVVNVGHPEGSDELEKVLGATMASVFRTVVRNPSHDTNTLLVATDASASRQRLLTAASRLPTDLRAIAMATAARIAPRLDGGRVFTDDKAPVEWLIDSSIVEVASQGERGG